MKNRYQVSEAFKENCKENIGLNRYGRIHVVEDDLDIAGENYNGQLIDFTIEDNCYTKDTFIGTTEAKKITVNILNTNNDINLENKTIEVYAGIEIDGQLEEIPYGTYIIEKPDNQEVQQKTSFIGYDYMIKFNALYVHDDSIVYPIKLSELLEKLCKQVGLELGSTEFTNSDYMVIGNPFTNNEDCRTVLSNIAQLAGGFAKIGRDNKVYIRSLKNIPQLLRVKDVHNMPVKDLHVIPVNMLATYKENTKESLNGNNYFEDFSKNEQWGEVNSLVINISEVQGENTSRTDEESIEKNGLTEITITDNYFLINEEERNKVIDKLWNALKGLHYLPFKTKYYGYPHIDSGDSIAVEDTQDIQYLSYVFNHTFTFNGAFDGKLETTAMTKAQVTYKSTQDIKSKFRKVELAVDKINGRITSVVERQDEQENTFKTEIEQTETSILNTVSANYATQTSLNNVNQTLTASLELKVDTKKLISEINASADQINLKAGRLVITAGNFQLDANGNITAIGGKIGGFNISSTYLANGTTTLAGANNSVYIGTNGISCGTAFKVKNNGQVQILDTSDSSIDFFEIINNKDNRKMKIGCYGLINSMEIAGTTIQPGEIGVSNISGDFVTIISSYIEVFSEEKNQYTTIEASGIETPKLTQTSLKSKKKNIQKFNADAIEMVKNADICLYNLKGEEKGAKKHLGLVIGEGYNCPDLVISEDRKGIEQYSYTSLLYKAFQQLLEKVESLSIDYQNLLENVERIK